MSEILYCTLHRCLCPRLTILRARSQLESYVRISLSRPFIKSGISTSDLFNSVLARLRNTRRREHRSTPVPSTLTSEKNGRRIMLTPLVPHTTRNPRNLAQLKDKEEWQMMVTFKTLGPIYSDEWREYLLNAPTCATENILDRPGSDEWPQRCRLASFASSDSESKSNEGYDTGSSTSPSTPPGPEHSLSGDVRIKFDRGEYVILRDGRREGIFQR